MSPNSNPPMPTVSREDAQSEVLDSLTGLYIKGFSDSRDDNPNTPSSSAISTPPALDYSAMPSSWDKWGPLEPEMIADTPIAPPNAPLIRDFDSFTEGTAQGSFDFGSTFGDDDDTLPLFYHPPENFALDLSNVPELDEPISPVEPSEAVLKWLAVTFKSLPEDESPKEDSPRRKRRRSVSEDTEDQPPRHRLWTPTIESLVHLVPTFEEDGEESLDQAEYRNEPDPPG